MMLVLRLEQPSNHLYSIGVYSYIILTHNVNCHSLKQMTLLYPLLIYVTFPPDIQNGFRKVFPIAVTSRYTRQVFFCMFSNSFSKVTGALHNVNDITVNCHRANTVFSRYTAFTSMFWLPWFLFIFPLRSIVRCFHFLFHFLLSFL